MKKIYSFLSLCLLFLGLTTATAQTAELKLTFDRTGDNVSVSVAGLDGVTASVVSKSHDWKDLSVANANTVLCPNVNGNTDPTITWGIQLNGVPANYKLKGMALDIHALNGAGQYQDPADNVNRHWNVAVAQGETPVANFADIEISQGTEEGRTMGNNHKVHSVAAAEALAATDPMTLNFTVTKGSENKGCFFGLSEVTLTYEVEEVVEPEPEVPATPLEFVKANPVLESEVTSLSSITLTFNKEIASISAEPYMFWFIDSDMNMYDAEVQINATDAKTLTITLAEEIKEAGTYIAMFSKGALVAADGTSNETVVELAWTVKPEVVEPEVPTTPEGRTVYFYHPEYVGFLTMAADGSECSLVKDFSVENLSAYEWVLEPAAGENQYYVLNKATGFYLGQCLTSTTVTGVNAAAKQAYELSKNGIYDVLKDVTGSTYNYLHVAGHNVVVGWEASAAASHWCLLGSVEEYNNVVNNLKLVGSLNEALTKAEELKEKSQPYFKALITEASQFSSNNKEATEGTYEGLIDGDNTTFFHSNWHGGGPEPHDLQVVLKDNEETNFLVKYESRNSSGY